MQRRSALFILWTALVSLGFAQTSTDADSVTLKDGTPVKLRMAMTVSSGKAQTGDKVELTVAEDVTTGSRVIIPSGSKAFGSVLMPDKKKKGEVSINISEVTLSDGSKAALRARESAVGGSRTLEFFPSAPPFLYTDGKDLVIPKDTQVTAYIDGELKLSAAAFQERATPVASTPTPGESASEVDVFSSPIGADVEIDGIFIGQTPTAAAVPSGEHTLLLRISGYDPWRQTFRADGSKLKFTAQLGSSGKNGETVTCWDAAECVNATAGIAAGTTTKPVAQQKKNQSTSTGQ